MAGTTFEKYGGFATVSKVVMRFYEMVLDSDEVGHFFDDIDMPRLMDHQTKFVSSLMGGPAATSDNRLKAAHQGLDITDAHFDEIARLLVEAMSEFDMAPEDIDSVVRSVEAKRSLIVPRAAA